MHDVPSRLLRARCMGVGLTKLTRCLGTNSTLRTLECSQVREASFVLVRRPGTSPSPEPNPAQARKPPTAQARKPLPSTPTPTTFTTSVGGGCARPRSGAAHSRPSALAPSPRSVTCSPRAPLWTRRSRAACSPTICTSTWRQRTSRPTSRASAPPRGQHSARSVSSRSCCAAAPRHRPLTSTPSFGGSAPGRRTCYLLLTAYYLLTSYTTRTARSTYLLL